MGAKLTFQEVLDATGGRLLHGKLNGAKGVSTDTRTMAEGDMFIALRGSNFDGHNFIKEALNKGGGAVVSIPPAVPPAGKVVVLVPDTLKALQDIARYVRKRAGFPVIGITGSNGKTTTKEMAALVLGRKYKVLKNAGNLNNQVGLPLSLLAMEGDEQVAVLEMGASAAGDIKELCDIALPDCGMLTNIGPAHIERFGSLETVRSTKLEMLAAIKTVVLNADDQFLMEGIGNFSGRIVRYGMGSTYDVYASDVSLRDRDSSFTLHMGGAKARLHLAVAGAFNIYNALAAAAVGHIFGVGVEDAAAALETFSGVPMRLAIKGFKGAVVISDVYNANPASMEEAIKEMARLRKTRAIAVLGDMLELGPYAETAHRELGRRLCSLPVDLFIAVGPNMALAAEEFRACGRKAVGAEDAGGARKALLGECMEGDVVLIKGSRGMQMEKVLEDAV